MDESGRTAVADARLAYLRYGIYRAGVCGASTSRLDIPEFRHPHFSFLDVILRKALAMSQPILASSQFVPFSSGIWLSSRFLPWNPLVYCLVSAILAIAYWLVLELSFEVYLTFKRHDSL
jgi:hypothetical protein